MYLASSRYHSHFYNIHVSNDNVKTLWEELIRMKKLKGIITWISPLALWRSVVSFKSLFSSSVGEKCYSLSSLSPLIVFTPQLVDVTLLRTEHQTHLASSWDTLQHQQLQIQIFPSGAGGDQNRANREGELDSHASGGQKHNSKWRILFLRNCWKKLLFANKFAKNIDVSTLGSLFVSVAEGLTRLSC